MSQAPDHFDAAPPATVRAWRFPSRSKPGTDYVTALQRDGTFSCECWPFLKYDACAHIEAVRQLLANEARAEERQAELDARLGCRHPLTVDEEEPDDGTACWPRVERRCLGCDHAYNREPVLRRLEADIRERHRLPPSPLERCRARWRPVMTRTIRTIDGTPFKMWKPRRDDRCGACRRRIEAGTAGWRPAENVCGYKPSARLCWGCGAGGPQKPAGPTKEEA